MKKLFALGTLLALSMPVTAGFQSETQNRYQARNAQNITTIAAAKKANEDTPVSLTGYITQQISDDDFYFKDSTGEIKIEIDDDVWENRTITPKDRITIEGKVDDGKNGNTIDVYRIIKH